MDIFQFFPTPEALAFRAWRKFKDRDFRRVLEPSAGDGRLAKAIPGSGNWHRRQERVDCVEIDISKHPTLRGHGLNVVGIDFLKFGSGAMYSHIIMNPPFAQGAEHVLKAWDILWDGEIVAILNAETIRNPFSKERQLLVDLIEQFGEVEFIEGAFSVPDAERKTDVDVALVYLRKVADTQHDIVGDALTGLKQDTTVDELDLGYRQEQQLALPNSTIENSVRALNAAWEAARLSTFGEARATYYAKLLGATMASRNGDAGADEGDCSVEWVRDTLHKRYEELKDRAWSGILRSSHVTDRLSSAGQKQVEAQFAEIKNLEFTVSNVYGFLLGIVQNQGQIQLDMACSVFDEITRYHSDNAVFYKGWKSNDKHRRAGMRIKTTRFVLPRHATESYLSQFRYDTERLLSDFDKVFAMLDGKTQPPVSLVAASRAHFNELRRGARISASYFDIRHYPGAGTIHFFPRSKKLVDRLNRLVGRHRQWLPADDSMASDAYWDAYQKAETFDKEVRAEVNRAHKGSHWDHPLHRLNLDHDESGRAMDALDNAMTAVFERHGIDVDRLLEPAQKRLAAA